MTREDVAYAAGIIDGEGYVGITVTQPSPSRKSRSPAFLCVVSVGMVDPEVVDWLHRAFGGKVYSYEAGRHGRGRGLHHWRLAGCAAVEFCRLVRPHLRLKHRQAELLSRYWADPHRVQPHGRRLLESEIAYRHRYAAESRLLNRRQAVSQ